MRILTLPLCTPLILVPFRGLIRVLDPANRPVLLIAHPTRLLPIQVPHGCSLKRLSLFLHNTLPLLL